MSKITRLGEGKPIKLIYTVHMEFTTEKEGVYFMKKYLYIALTVMLLISMTACVNGPSQSPAQTETSPPSTSAPAVSTQTPTSAIVFNDNQLEGKIRDTMGKPEGDITQEEAAAVAALNLSNDSFDHMNTKDGGIKDIRALQYFTGLTELGLAFNNVSDLTPLSGLTKLETLDISGTQVEDLSPLKDMKSIKCLVFCWLHADDGTPKGIGSLDALAGFQNLEMLDAKNAGITDVSALADLPKLWEVQLNDNEITDVTPLAHVKNLKLLLLAGNPIADYSPLGDIYPQLEGKDFEIN